MDLSKKIVGGRNQERKRKEKDKAKNGSGKEQKNC
jgi:hypothetical protein